MKKIVVDLDGTLTLNDPATPYERQPPNVELIDRLKRYRNDGFIITIFTARNMRTHEGNIGKINKLTLPTIMAWLEEHEVPYDELLVGKPWCGDHGFYIDDKAIRPDEFASMTYDEISRLLTLGPTS